MYRSVLKPCSLQNMHSIGVFFSTHCFGLVKYSRKSKRFTALVACVPLVQKDSWSLCILISVNRILGRIKSSRFIRAKVDFHSNPTSILYFFYEEIYLELSPFAVKPMFWFSIWTNQITGNYISSSGCELRFLEVLFWFLLSLCIASF